MCTHYINTHHYNTKEKNALFEINLNGNTYINLQPVHISLQKHFRGTVMIQTREITDKIQ